MKKSRQGNCSQWIHFCLTKLRKNQSNNIKIFTTKRKSIIKYDKLSRSKSCTTKYTVKKNKNCATKGETGIVLKIDQKKNAYLMVKHVIQIKNGITKNDNVNVKIIVSTENIIFGIPSHVWE